MSDQVIFLDATKRFPFDSNVLDYVFSEHMIEHISYKQGIAMMREIYRVLKPGGKVRIATPDIEKIVGLLLPQKTVDQKHYIKWKAVDYMGLYSPEPSQLQKRREEWDIDFRHIQHYYPNVEADGACFIVNNFFRGYGHQFLYDIRSLMAITKEAGFIEPRIFKPNESDDIHLSHLESHANLIGNDMNNFETMVLQAVHP
jgi:SAM-dependent methyltransferase